VPRGRIEGGPRIEDYEEEDMGIKDTVVFTLRMTPDRASAMDEYFAALTKSGVEPAAKVVVDRKGKIWFNMTLTIKRGWDWTDSEVEEMAKRITTITGEQPKIDGPFTLPLPQIPSGTPK
jgi:hypothetical protein